MSDIEIVKQFKLEGLEVITNIGKQVITVECKLLKYEVLDRTLFEKYIIGYKPYFYRLEIVYQPAIRHNRDKYFLGNYSDEGNDCVYDTSIGLGYIKSDNEVIFMDFNKMVIDNLKSYDPNFKLKISKMRESKRPRPLRWYGPYYDCKNAHVLIFEAYVLTYPFYGDDLSGCTSLFGCGFEKDCEGSSVYISFIGFHMHLTTEILRFIDTKIVRMSDYPNWSDKEGKKTWKKKHSILNFFNKEKHFSIGFSIANGFYIKCQLGFEWETNIQLSINPFRNKYWNLI
jgi:hypothetical protein